MAKDLVSQTNLAFDYVQKLYNEVATLISEIEGAVLEQEQLRIGKPSGHAISTRGSTGLERQNVQRWLTRRFAVFFVREEDIVEKAGQTATGLQPTLRVAYVRVLLDGYENYSFNGEPLERPTVLFGYLEKFAWFKAKANKLENLMTHIEYKEQKIFADLPVVNFKDSTFNSLLFGFNNVIA